MITREGDKVQFEAHAIIENQGKEHVIASRSVPAQAVAAARMPNDAFITIPDTIYGETRIYFFTRKSSFVSSPVTIKRSVGNISLILISTAYHLTANFEHRA